MIDLGFLIMGVVSACIVVYTLVDGIREIKNTKR